MMQSEKQDDYAVPYQVPTELAISSIPSFVRKLYPLSSIDNCTRLPSYADLNYKFDATLETSPKNDKRTFVLKILNWRDSKYLPEIEGQNDLMTFLHDQGLPTQVPLTTRTGKRTILHGFDHPEYKHGTPLYAVRVLNYLPGKPLASPSPVPMAYCNVGKFVGSLSRHLKHFPVSHALRERVFRWDLARVNESRRYLDAVVDSEKLRLLNEVLDLCDSEIIPVLKSLPKMCIHGDLSESNILMDGDGCNVVGLLDFGDVVYSYRVCDIAIALASFYVESKGLDAVPDSFLAGYQSVCSLSSEELGLVHHLTLARMAQVYILTAHMRILQPDNDYLKQYMQPVWDTLSQLWQSSRLRKLQL
eukprot:m.110618 g.110618  ORF g.110618 m.110618 type:complete len:360 (+) comp37411_c0_seq2:615-1694(+)